MAETYNSALIVGAALSMIAALLHIAIIFGGPNWYRFFGAGRKMAEAAERAEWYPTIITFGIAAVLGVWSTYALSGAGVLRPLPLLRQVLCAMTAIYLLRGLVLVPVLAAARNRVTPFLVWSSLICMLYGVTHLIGLVQIWSRPI